MSNLDINLVSPKRVSSKTLKNLQILRISAIFSLIIVVLLSFFLFFLNAATSLSSIQRDQDRVLAEITVLNERAARFNVVRERISAVSDILSSRVNYHEIIELVLSEKPDQVVPSSLSIDRRTVSVIVTSDSLLPLNRYLDALVEISLDDPRLGGLSVDSLSVNQRTGLYSMSLRVNINE